jgi:hypothetical protein
MSLNWDISGVKNHAVLSIHPDDREKAAANPDGTYRLNPVTNALIWGTMTIDIGQITEKNWKEVYRRIRAYERLVGAINQYYKPDGTHYPRYVTAQDVYDHIGLRTNVATRTSAQWASRLLHMTDADVEADCLEIKT